MNRIIAIDFDGTLFEDDYPNIGAPIRGIIARAKQEQANGAKLILWTLREGELLEKAITACKRVGLVFDSINGSLPEEITLWGHDPRKVAATEYWDDRAAKLKTCVICKHAFKPAQDNDCYFCKCESSPCYGRMVTGDDYCRFAEMEQND